MVGEADTTVGTIDPGAEAQGRCEVLAALCLAAAAAIVVHGITRAAAYGRLDPAQIGDISGWQLVEMAAGSSSFLPFVAANGTSAIAVTVLAYLLVAVVGPGTTVGPVGSWVLRGTVATGALLGIAGVIATVAILRRQGQIEAAFGFDGTFEGSGGDTVLSVLDRGGAALPAAVGGIVCAYVAWCAYRTLEGPAAADEADGTDDLGGDLDPYGADVDPLA